MTCVNTLSRKIPGMFEMACSRDSYRINVRWERIVELTWILKNRNCVQTQIFTYFKRLQNNQPFMLKKKLYCRSVRANEMTFSFTSFVVVELSGDFCGRKFSTFSKQVFFFEEPNDFA